MDGRTLSIISPLGRGGGSRGGITPSMLNLASALAELRISVELVCFYPESARLLADKVPPNVSLEILRGGGHRRSLAQLIAYFRRRRPSRVLAAGHRFNVLAVTAGARVDGSRVYVGIRNTVSREIASMGRLRRRRWVGQARRLYPQASGIIAVSRGAAEDFARVAGLPVASVSYAYNPIVTDELLSGIDAPVAHPWLTDGGPPVITAVGRLEAQKNYPALLRAFARLRAARECRLLVLGEGTRRGELEAMSRRLGLEGAVSMPGFVDNPAAHIRASAAYALSSSFEGLPAALIQAMATGTPVVSTDCESGPREILAEGRYGRLVPVGDSAALADALALALDEPRRTLPPEAINRFRPRACAKRYLELIQLPAA